MDDNEKYSPLVRRLKKTFEFYADGPYKALFVYADRWGNGPYYAPVSDQSDLWPWTAFDNHPFVWSEGLKDQNGNSKALIAFDLRKTFDEQIPEHLRQARKLDCFIVSPLIHIPDRVGKVPYVEQTKFRSEALAKDPRPKLRLIQT